MLSFRVFKTCIGANETARGFWVLKIVCLITHLKMYCNYLHKRKQTCSSWSFKSSFEHFTQERMQWFIWSNCWFWWWEYERFLNKRFNFSANWCLSLSVAASETLISFTIITNAMVMAKLNLKNALILNFNRIWMFFENILLYF